MNEKDYKKLTLHCYKMIYGSINKDSIKAVYQLKKNQMFNLEYLCRLQNPIEALEYLIIYAYLKNNFKDYVLYKKNLLNSIEYFEYKRGNEMNDHFFFSDFIMHHIINKACFIDDDFKKMKKDDYFSPTLEQAFKISQEINLENEHIIENYYEKLFLPVQSLKIRQR